MRVLICGGGIAGLSLAGCLHAAGHRPVVVERAPGLRDEGYMVDFFGSGYDTLERLGLGAEVARIDYPIARLAFVDADGAERMSLPYPLLRKRLFDDRHFNFMRGDLERVLAQWIAGKVEIRYKNTVEAIDQRADGVRVTLGDGKVEDVDLVVGADGVHSHVRRLAFGDEARFSRFIGCCTAAYVVEQPPRDAPADAFVTLTVPGRQVAVYPIRGARCATFLVHRTPGLPSDASPAATLRALRAAYGHLGWIVPELLERAATTSSLYFDAVSQVEMPEWSRGRVVLLGDACSCVSLLAGQGASMAVAGGYVLAEELDAANADVGAALRRYEARLRPAIERKQAAGRRIAGWFVPETRFRLWLRDLGLRASVWPIASRIVRRRLAAESIFHA